MITPKPDLTEPVNCRTCAQERSFDSPVCKRCLNEGTNYGSYSQYTPSKVDVKA